MVEKINNKVSGKILIRNTQILTMTGAALQNGDILIENDKIAVGGRSGNRRQTHCGYAWSGKHAHPCRDDFAAQLCRRYGVNVLAER